MDDLNITFKLFGEDKNFDEWDIVRHTAYRRDAGSEEPPDAS